MMIIAGAGWRPEAVGNANRRGLIRLRRTGAFLVSPSAYREMPSGSMGARGFQLLQQRTNERFLRNSLDHNFVRGKSFERIRWCGTKFAKPRGADERRYSEVALQRGGG